MAEAVRWRLTSLLHDDVDEPEDGASLKVAAGLGHSGLRDLIILGPAGPICRVPLDEDGGGFSPVFYRRRSLVLDGAGNGSLDAIVFGRQREGRDGRVDAELWLLERSGRVVPCPADLIDPVALADLDQAF